MELTMRRNVSRVATCCCLAILLACQGGTPTDASAPIDVSAPASTGNPPAVVDSIRFLHAPASAPALEADSVAFWAVQGEERQVELHYVPTSGNSSTRFLRFRVRKQTQMRRPDGTVLADGDSIRIRITVVDASRLLTKFEPAGLRFEGGGSARLQLSYAEVGDDLDGDGLVSGNDSTVTQSLSIFRREHDTAPWFRVTSVHDLAIDELEAVITGFTNYVIAY